MNTIFLLNYYFGNSKALAIQMKHETDHIRN